MRRAISAVARHEQLRRRLCGTRGTVLELGASARWRRHTPRSAVAECWPGWRHWLGVLQRPGATGARQVLAAAPYPLLLATLLLVSGWQRLPAAVAAASGNRRRCRRGSVAGGTPAGSSSRAAAWIFSGELRLAVAAGVLLAAARPAA